MCVRYDVAGRCRMRTERPEPILPVHNLDEARAFYAKAGFAPWFNGRWNYEIVSRGHLVIHFVENRELIPGQNESSCYWRVKDADRFYSELRTLGLPSAGIPRLTAPEDKPWGMREFALVDPSGNLIRIGHDLGEAYVPAEP